MNRTPPTVPHTLIVADLHLAPERPDIFAAFRAFLAGTATRAQSLYILGDLFEAWAGDDDRDDPFNREVAATLAKLSAGGCALYLMHGNRDFLIGQRFADACGASLLDDPALVEMHGAATLLTHGDLLCSGDADYLAFRATVRSPDWQRRFLAQPLPQRKAQIAGLRAQSRLEQSRKPAAIMDADVETVDNILRKYGYPRLVHGHTHRPARHLHRVDGRACERWVLPDWHAQGGYLRCDASGCGAVALAINPLEKSL